jgi:GT2 family glycosyltransferase
LQGLAAQMRQPDEIIVVRRLDDSVTGHVIEEFGRGLIGVNVARAGLVAALLGGAQHASGQVIAFTDDDAVPRPDWVLHLVAAFADPTVGGVGGRDVLPQSTNQSLSTDVGRLTRWGRVIGNHHRGTGGARDVDVLKGVNMAFRREALALPEELRGSGAQPHSEYAICLWARRRGWRLVYDPAILVDHYPAERPSGDQRASPYAAAVRNNSYNYVATIASLEPKLFWWLALYGLLVGSRAYPGLARAVAAIPFGDWQIAHNLIPSIRGKLEALLDISRGRSVRMQPIARLSPGHPGSPILPDLEGFPAAPPVTGQ